MFAHRVVALTGPAAVHWTQVVEPAADGGVVIDVVAAGVSFADLLQTTGAYQLKVPLPFTPGMDAAGTVRSARADLGLTPCMPWTACPGERGCLEPSPLVKARAQLSAGRRCCPLLSPASCPRHAPRAPLGL